MYKLLSRSHYIVAIIINSLYCKFANKWCTLFKSYHYFYMKSLTLRCQVFSVLCIALDTAVLKSCTVQHNIQQKYEDNDNQGNGSLIHE